jgi:nucleotide-binding universal stress UspA family protein
MHEIAWRKVCCPVDDTDASRAALRVALDLCRRLGAELTLLHVEGGDEVTSGGHAGEWQKDVAEAGVPTRGVETRGDPKTAIAEWSNDHDIDAIVMGTQGRTGREHALAGSVAENTLRQARCPVMVVHAEWAAQH